MNVVIGSAFRNCESTLGRYFAQVLELRAELGSKCSVRIIAAEGDSQDRTRELLGWWGHETGIPVEIVDATHGGPVFGSTESPERLAALSTIGDKILAAVREGDDFLIYVESDLIWNAATMHYLLRRARTRAGVYAPMVFAGELFYDVWGYRKDGVRFSPFPPYHAGLHEFNITPVDSVGSCLVMHANIARVARMNGGCLVGFCEDVRRRGWSVFVDPLLRVKHPC